MFIIGTYVHNNVRSSNISAEWLELRINLDDSKVKTSQRICLLDCVYTLEQCGNSTILMRSTVPNFRCRLMEIRNGILLTNRMSLKTVTCRYMLMIDTSTLKISTCTSGVLCETVFPFSELRSGQNILFTTARSLQLMGRFKSRGGNHKNCT